MRTIDAMKKLARNDGRFTETVVKPLDLSMGI